MSGGFLVHSHGSLPSRDAIVHPAGVQVDIRFKFALQWRWVLSSGQPPAHATAGVIGGGMRRLSH